MLGQDSFGQFALGEIETTGETPPSGLTIEPAPAIVDVLAIDPVVLVYITPVAATVGGHVLGPIVVASENYIFPGIADAWADVADPTVIDVISGRVFGPIVQSG